MGLQPREKRTLILGGGFLFLMVVLYFFYLSEDSLYHRWTELRNDVASRREVLARVVREQVRYRDLRRDVVRITDRMADAGADATLRGYLERLIKAKAPDAQLKRMPSRDQTVADLYRRTQVTIDLEDVTIPELVAIMSAMESSDQGIKVQGLKVTLDRRSEDQLNAVITIIAARPLN